MIQEEKCGHRSRTVTKFGEGEQLGAGEGACLLALMLKWGSWERCCELAADSRAGTVDIVHGAELSDWFWTISCPGSFL